MSCLGERASFHLSCLHEQSSNQGERFMFFLRISLSGMLPETIRLLSPYSRHIVFRNIAKFYHTSRRAHNNFKNNNMTVTIITFELNRVFQKVCTKTIITNRRMGSFLQCYDFFIYYKFYYLKCSYFYQI